jgi:hypothetical protein
MGDVQAWAYGAHSYRRDYDQNGRIESHTRGSSTRRLGFDLASRIVERKRPVTPPTADPRPVLRLSR